MTITLITGSMMAGKSTMLLMYEKRFKNSKKSYILINHSFDDRYSSDGKIASHDGKYSDGQLFRCKSLNELENEISDVLKDVDCIIIDEVQFFDDIEDFCRKWGDSKILICAGLNSDYRMRSFPNLLKVVPMADKIIHLTAICECGSDASFSARISEETEDIVIGGAEKYKPVCRECFNKINKKL
jgi:thymidine kinase